MREDVTTVVLEPETISLEVEEGEDAAVEDELTVDLGEDEVKIPADTFLEEPEGDEEADVTGIVGGPGKREET